MPLKQVTITTNGEIVGGHLFFDNDVGGTEAAPKGTYHIVVLREFYDYETGDRAIGTLTRPEEIERLVKAGTTRYEPKNHSWHPARVYFHLADATEVN